MRKNILVCDYCEDDKKVVVAIISRGGDKGKYLCADCVAEFLTALSYEYINEVDDVGDWRLANYKVKLVSEKEVNNEKKG